MKAMLAGAALGALLLGAIPASARTVVHTGHGAVVIKRDHPHHRRHCRTVRTRTHLPNGNVIVKTRRVCRR